MTTFTRPPYLCPGQSFESPATTSMDRVRPSNTFQIAPLTSSRSTRVSASTLSDLFRGMTIFIQRDGNKKATLRLVDAIMNNGGNTRPTPWDGAVTHILLQLPQYLPSDYIYPLSPNDTDAYMTRDPWCSQEDLVRCFAPEARQLKMDSSTSGGRVKVLNIHWVHECLRKAEIVDEMRGWGGHLMRRSCDPRLFNSPPSHYQSLIALPHPSHRYRQAETPTTFRWAAPDSTKVLHGRSMSTEGEGSGWEAEEPSERSEMSREHVVLDQERLEEGMLGEEMLEGHDISEEDGREGLDGAATEMLAHSHDPPYTIPVRVDEQGVIDNTVSSIPPQDFYRTIITSPPLSPASSRPMTPPSPMLCTLADPPRAAATRPPSPTLSDLSEICESDPPDSPPPMHGNDEDSAWGELPLDDEDDRSSFDGERNDVPFGLGITIGGRDINAPTPRRILDDSPAALELVPRSNSWMISSPPNVQDKEVCVGDFIHETYPSNVEKFGQPDITAKVSNPFTTLENSSIYLGQATNPNVSRYTPTERARISTPVSEITDTRTHNSRSGSTSRTIPGASDLTRLFRSNGFAMLFHVSAPHSSKTLEILIRTLGGRIVESPSSAQCIVLEYPPRTKIHRSPDLDLLNAIRSSVGPDDQPIIVSDQWVLDSASAKRMMDVEEYQLEVMDPDILGTPVSPAIEDPHVPLKEIPRKRKKSEEEDEDTLGSFRRERDPRLESGTTDNTLAKRVPLANKAKPNENGIQTLHIPGVDQTKAITTPMPNVDIPPTIRKIHIEDFAWMCKALQGIKPHKHRFRRSIMERLDRKSDKPFEQHCERLYKTYQEEFVGCFPWMKRYQMRPSL